MLIVDTIISLDQKIREISLENEIDDCPVCNNDYYNTYTIEPWTSSDRMSESNHTEKCAIFTHDRFML